jgi:hypothetical protein
MLKKISLMFAMTFVIGSMSYAQNADSTTQSAPKTTTTLFGALKPKISKLGLYVSSEFQYFGAAGAYTPARGASGMLLINERLGIGVAGASVRGFNPTALNNAGLQMRYAYGGAQLEYTIAPHRLVHVTIPLLIGGGTASVDSSGFGRRGKDGIKDGDGKDGIDNFRNDRNPFFVIQPGLRIEANLFRFAKFYIGANYRAVLGTSSVTYPTGTTTATLTNSQLSGASFTAGVKIGLFDYKLRK